MNVNVSVTRNSRRCCKPLLEWVEVRDHLSQNIPVSKSTTVEENSEGFFVCSAYSLVKICMYYVHLS